MFLTRATRNTIFGASMPDKPIPSWDALLSSAAHLQQLANQLANPLPFDLDDTNLAEYKHLIKEYQDWNNIRQICSGIAVNVIHPML